jgi:hypothetical protein
MVNASDFRAELNRLFREAAAQGLPYVDVTAGELHRRVGGGNVSSILGQLWREISVEQLCPFWLSHCLPHC